jgi:hypothetical protein
MQETKESQHTPARTLLGPQLNHHFLMLDKYIRMLLNLMHRKLQSFYPFLIVFVSKFTPDVVVVNAALTGI